MKTCFQITECSFASAKILEKSEITKRIATFFILSPIFSCEIKISVVSLQNEDEAKRWNRKVVKKTRNAILQVIVNKGNNNKKILYKKHLNSRICAAFFILILEKVYDLTFVIIEKVCNFLVFIIKKVYLYCRNI